MKLKNTDKFINLYKNHDTSFFKTIIDNLIDTNGLYNNTKFYNKYFITNNESYYYLICYIVGLYETLSGKKVPVQVTFYSKNNR